MSALAFRPLDSSELPIFRRNDPGRSLFYAPGYLVVASPAAADVLTEQLVAPNPPPGPAADLRQYALTAQRVSVACADRPFRPICLTLYLHNECNLRCAYCFAEAKPSPGPRLELTAVCAAARLVAETCHTHGLPMTLVCHGGGEPALHPELLAQTLDVVESTAAAHGVSLFRYIATNGALPVATAAWIARHFDQVGLSCDGPADVQVNQRPLWGGGDSATLVERTARIVVEHGIPLHVRVTVTRQSLERQPEIAEYICHALRPAEIHVEAVYAAGRASALGADDADRFVAGFLAARQIAARYGIAWINSGSRLAEIHGPYCHVFRDVLNLVPGGIATGCFLVTGRDEAERRRIDIGGQDGPSFTIDQERVAALRRGLAGPPTACSDCFNRYHCARACPDACELIGPPPTDGFLCRVRRRLAEAAIDALADRLWQSLGSENGCAAQALR